MRQGDGETHAIHTVLGRSGAVAGFSLQRTEGAGCFKRAMKEWLPYDARCTVRFVFSDSPDAVEGADSVLPHLEAVGEDALHFVLRVEACSGEKRTALSRRLLSIQGKFRAPATGRVYHGREDGVPHGVWPEHEEKVVEEVDWGTYMKKPFESHQEYVDAVHGLTLDFPSEMDRKDAKGRSIREILKAGVSYRHYRYLMNGSYIMDAVVRVVGPEAARLMSWGTCGNEALHAQLKASQQTIVQQHLEAFPLQLQAFGLAKLMAHHCAAFCPSIAQRSEAEILCVLQGELCRVQAHGHAVQELKSVASRAELRKPLHHVTAELMAARKLRSAEQARRWQVEAARREEKKLLGD